jgi:hypothetical protein
MPTARESLIGAIEEHKYEVIVRVCNRLQKFSYSHYETISYERHQEREELFLNVMLRQLRDEDSNSLNSYLEHLAEQRSNEGYSLQEVEEAFDIVEDTLWQVLAKYWPLEQSLIEGLTIIRKLFQEIKNSLGQLFLEEVLSAQKFENILRKFTEYRSEIASHS